MDSEHPIPPAMDPETEPEHVESEPEPEPEPEPRRRRGPTTGQTYRSKVKEPDRRVEFGADGNVCGPSAAAFANYVGQAARDHVPINFTSWKKVPEKPIKEDIWVKIKVKIN